MNAYFVSLSRQPFNPQIIGQPQSLLGPRPSQGLPAGPNMVFNRPPLDLRAIAPNQRPNFGNVLPHLNLPGMQVSVSS